MVKQELSEIFREMQGFLVPQWKDITNVEISHDHFKVTMRHGKLFYLNIHLSEIQFLINVIREGRDGILIVSNYPLEEGVPTEIFVPIPADAFETLDPSE